VCVYGYAVPFNYANFDLLPMNKQAYGNEEYGTVLHPGYNEYVYGRMAAFVPLAGWPVGSKFVKKDLGWFKWNVYEDFDYTAVLKMGVNPGWWLDEVRYASTDKNPSDYTRETFCTNAPEEKYPHVFNIDKTHYDPYGMSSATVFKRTCLASYVKNWYNKYGNYCQATEDKWGHKNCPPHNRRLIELLAEGDEVPAFLSGDDDTIVTPGRNQLGNTMRGRKLNGAFDRKCYKEHKLMIRGRFCTWRENY
jgi:hypothetical protein